YPHYASQVALAVAGGEVDGGILICGTGVGISIAANKFAGIRAVVCSEPYSAQLSRQHNDTNVLAFGSRAVGLEQAKMIV
ncbi:bifunctional allose-6-phosphate isomerase/ribose-5-phosphate isomerase RpiB, partial [Escherichia coli]|nr:bifunctional allose-6-phosphate isomerase/ribose-5-phosphate isomerase RpiB [Escherichia coli]